MKQFSSTASSSKNGWSAPNPTIEATISRAACASSRIWGNEPLSARSL